MDIFESAHRSREETPKKMKKNRKTVKKHLKRMLNAYKDGNKEELKNIAQTSLKYDTDDAVSLSDYSDINFSTDINTTQETVSSNIINESNVESKSNETVSEKGYNDTLKSLIKNKDNSKTQSSSEDNSLSHDNSSLLDNVSNDSDITIPSSLQSSDVSDIISDDEPFDPDGLLAIEIIKKLKTKESELGHQPSIQHKKKSVSQSLNIEQKIIKDIKNQKIEEDSISNNESLMDADEETENFNILRQVDDEITDESSQDSDPSIEIESAPYIAVTAIDTPYQTLTDVIGDYQHSTIKKLCTDRQNTIDNSDLFEPEFGPEDVAEEVDSLIPELDEDLAIEDLNLDSDTQNITEDTTAYDDTILTDNVTDNESSDDIDNDRIKVYPGSNRFILVLRHPAELYIHGKVKVAGLGGTAELFGYTLRDDPVDVYAPYCYYAHSIKTVECQNMYRGLFSKLTQSGVSVSNTEEIVTSLGEFDAVISLSKLRNRAIEFVDNNFDVNDLFTKRSDSTPRHLKKVADDLGCSLYEKPHKKYLEEKESWDEVVNCGKVEQSRGIICGGKGTGKSTFLRYYINHILDSTDKPVLVIDLDPGQPEFTVPGNISVNIVNRPLIGPNFTHLRDPEKMLNLGMINTMDNPIRYISAIEELITHCRSNHTYREMPWIVNTMGMCNYMGLKFITYIILQLQPSFLYQIDSKTPKKRFDCDLHSLTIKKLYQDFSKDHIFRKVNAIDLDYTFIMERCKEVSLTEKGVPGSKMAPRDERYLNILAYFGTLLDKHNTQGLLEIVPYEVHLDTFNVVFNVKIPEEAGTKVINGKIIALCQLTVRDKAKVNTLADKALLCHGHGLIRGIDSENGLLYILTPAPLEKLKLVNTFLYSDWMPELLNQERGLPRGTIVPYRTTTVHQNRQLMFPPRRRFNPLQLIKMSRNT